MIGMNHVPRRLAFDAFDPKAMEGTRLYRICLKRYLNRCHEQAGWSAATHDEQSSPLFRFSGAIFKRYVQEVLGMDISRIYFPLAYYGVVARQLADNGYDVLASDLSDHWVQHLQATGLKAQKRSFEQLPRNRFDAVVMFEPYPLHETILGYLGMLRILARGISVTSMYCAWKHSVSKGAYAEKRGREFEESTYVDKEPHLLDRIAYDYGSAYLDYRIREFGVPRVVGKHRAFVKGDGLVFETVVPSEEAAQRARVDGRVLKLLETKDYAVSISITALARSLGLDVKTVAASLSRLCTIFNDEFKLHRSKLLGINDYNDKQASMIQPIQRVPIVP